MTSFVVWRSGTAARPASLYFASDSRRSWNSGEKRDDCIKLFAPVGSPDIFGMVGADITFPEAALPEVCSRMDGKDVPRGQMTSGYGRNDWVISALRERLAVLGSIGSFSIFHGTRNGFGMGATFAVFHIHFDPVDGSLRNDELEFSEEASCAATLSGSGAGVLAEHLRFWHVQSGQYSRGFFSGFCDALRSGGDPLSGGAPQLLALGTTGMPRHLGVVTRSSAFYRGGDPCAAPLGAQWRNELFERVDAQGRLLAGAQLQPRPKS